MLHNLKMKRNLFAAVAALALMFMANINLAHAFSSAPPAPPTAEELIEQRSNLRRQPDNVKEFIADIVDEFRKNGGKEVDVERYLDELNEAYRKYSGNYGDLLTYTGATVDAVKLCFRAPNLYYITGCAATVVLGSILLSETSEDARKKTEEYIRSRTRRQDEEWHRGRIQIQGPDIPQGTISASWTQKKPISKKEGRQKLALLEMQLTSRARSIRKHALTSAINYINRCPVNGCGIVSRSWPGTKYRVDIEIIEGYAFTGIAPSN